jgi:hypothetical protein
VGRETLAAIAEELAGRNSDREDSPEIEMTSGSIGRDTLAAIAAELLPGTRSDPPGPAGRARTKTLGYEDGAFGSATPPASKAPRPGVGRRSLESLEKKLGAWAEDEASTRSGPGQASSETPCEIYEMVTFVVRGDLARLSSTRARREFVAERLLSRLPVGDIAEVDRVDVTPWTVHGTVIVRVWCRVP